MKGSSPARTKGVNSRLLSHQEAIERHRDMDPQGKLTPEVMKRFILANMCPYCDRGPFRVLAVHTNKLHGIDALELRHLANMTSRERACSEEFSERARVLAFQRDIGHTLDGRGVQRAAPRLGGVSRMRIAEATRARMANTPAEVKSEWARKASASLTPEGRGRQLQALRSRKLSEGQKRRLYDAARSVEANAKRRATQDRNLQGHGTVASYKRGCRCFDCSEAKNAPRRNGRPTGRPRYGDRHLSDALRLMEGGMTQREAAKSVGVSEAWLSRKRRGGDDVSR